MLETGRQYAISEVAELTGYPPHVLRYYEKEFELIIPRNESNHRYYTYVEIELFQYIKFLQEKGFSNKQIKLILKSPDMLVNNNESAFTNISTQKNIDEVELAQRISLGVQNGFLNSLREILGDNAECTEKALQELMEEVKRLRNEINSKERDVLICENAKLKMKVKEKTYEIVNLKERIKRKENNKGFLRKLFQK